MLRPVELDDRLRRLVEQIDGQEQVLARCVQHRRVATQPGKDRLQHLQRRDHRLDDRRIAPRLRDPLEPHMPLLAQPVEHCGVERDAIGRRGLGEVGAAGIHRTIIAACSSGCSSQLAY